MIRTFLLRTHSEKDHLFNKWYQENWIDTHETRPIFHHAQKKKCSAQNGVQDLNVGLETELTRRQHSNDISGH